MADRDLIPGIDFPAADGLYDRERGYTLPRPDEIPRQPNGDPITPAGWDRSMAREPGPTEKPTAVEPEIPAPPTSDGPLFIVQQYDPTSPVATWRDIGEYYTRTPQGALECAMTEPHHHLKSGSYRVVTRALLVTASIDFEVQE